MSHFSPHLQRCVRRQHGVVTGDQLRADGISPYTIERWRLRHLLEPVHIDIYRLEAAPDTLEARCVVPTLAHPGAVVGGASAAALWDFDHVFRPTRADCVHGRDVVIGRPVGGVSYRPMRWLSDCDVVERGDAIRVLSRAATWLDCVGQMSIEHGATFTEHVLDSQCDVDELWNVVERREAARRGRPGRAHMLLSAVRRRGPQAA
ncbi:type IV toxin-antitoxin system AbiEi family antitoxin domain-containing protein [Ilumatobacter coccineus]|uniref:Transcriptional regulator, AbiEi antitoxin, Type IV TA system n=1 Tax=Ilumatobacter coccineus (strain NBRC 103263 / KCTC 29153 / YM16-304) TaxID=1313172 RepID=A0A6C7E9N9_ILUCY|nr:type IV toxin-antitoxin system AbiEi family antitoxin domain-containing protein [Ilumatobacter coccineus]BAN01328.1 hypothetical protein YM304_10140 [Ilumatobacter coccineus YM16-304]